MTKEQILQAEGDTLSRMAGEVLLNKHDVGNKGIYHVQCKECGEVMKLSERWDIAEHNPCPIPLTWPKAMKFFRAAADEDAERLLTAMVAIFLHEIDDDIGTANIIASRAISEVEDNARAWFLYYAQPKHYIKAAMLCKEQSNE